MEKYLSVLTSCPLFLDIQKDELLTMLSCLGGRVASFDKKYTVLAEGGSADYMGVVLSGSVQVVQMDYFGNRNVLGVFHRGEVFAEAFACAEVKALPVSVIAAEECTVLFLDSRHILATCQKGCTFHKKLIYNLMRDLAKKTVSFHRRAEIISGRTTEKKLMSYLALCAKEEGASTFLIPYDRQGLADFLEVDRSGLSAVIGRLQKQGVLLCKKNRFTLL